MVSHLCHPANDSLDGLFQELTFLLSQVLVDAFRLSGAYTAFGRTDICEAQGDGCTRLSDCSQITEFDIS